MPSSLGMLGFSTLKTETVRKYRYKTYRRIAYHSNPAASGAARFVLGSSVLLGYARAQQ